MFFINIQSIKLSINKIHLQITHFRSVSHFKPTQRWEIRRAVGFGWVVRRDRLFHPQNLSNLQVNWVNKCWNILCKEKSQESIRSRLFSLGISWIVGAVFFGVKNFSYFSLPEEAVLDFQVFIRCSLATLTLHKFLLEKYSLKLPKHDVCKYQKLENSASLQNLFFQ